MLKISAISSFRTKVEFQVPVDGTDTTQTLSFQAHFKYKGRKEFDALMEASKGAKVPDQHILDEVLIGWDSTVGDAMGNALPFGPENLALLTGTYANARSAIVSTWVSANHGAKAGN